MKKIISLGAILFALSSTTFAQEKGEGHEHVNVPTAVKNANMQKYPESKTYHITWEKENGNYEANWGGKDGEANSVQYTPSGNFIEIVKAIPVHELPANTIAYVKEHYKVNITEAGKVTDAKGNTSYEAEVKGRDVIFDQNGNFVKAE
ncbi:MAG: PepSY-like domain-containing protein [Bacteroidota bacterium]|nr:PepSY-like domain-containing protein [Bacteroidota bacterium]